MNPTPIIGAPDKGRIEVEVVPPATLSEWPDLPGFPRPSNEYEEAKLVDELNAGLATTLDGEFGLLGLVEDGNQVILTNRDPKEVLSNIKRAEENAIQLMSDPVIIGLGSIHQAVFRSIMAVHLKDVDNSAAIPQPVDWQSLRDLLHEILPTAAIRINRGSGDDRIRAAQLVCLCRTPISTPGGPLTLFAAGKHPVVDDVFKKAQEIMKEFRQRKNRESPQ